jgi:hypothetical protein
LSSSSSSNQFSSSDDTRSCRPRCSTSSLSASLLVRGGPLIIHDNNRCMVQLDTKLDSGPCESAATFHTPIDPLRPSLI